MFLVVTLLRTNLSQSSLLSQLEVFRASEPPNNSNRFNSLTEARPANQTACSCQARGGGGEAGLRVKNNLIKFPTALISSLKWVLRQEWRSPYHARDVPWQIILRTQQSNLQSVEAAGIRFFKQQPRLADFIDYNNHSINPRQNQISFDPAGVFVSCSLLMNLKSVKSSKRKHVFFFSTSVRIP